MTDEISVVGGNPTINRSVVDAWSNYYMIDANHPISHDTTLVNFEIYAKRANPIQLIIYRKSGDAFEVVGKSAQVQAKVGMNKFALEQPIEAKAGDLIGFYYASTGVIAFGIEGNAWLTNGLGHSVYFTPMGGSDTQFIYSTPRTYSIRVSGRPAEVSKAEVVIHDVFYDGLEKRSEGDEYVAISNVGNAPADISGWRLHADDKGQDFTFPAGTTLSAEQTIRVYTNRDEPETGGFSFGSGRAIWNNKGDTASLLDADGAIVDTFSYTPLP